MTEQAKFIPQDNWIQQQYEKYGLGNDATLEQIEAVAKELLSDPTTRIAGAELILGRRIDSSETDIITLIFFQKQINYIFALLLLQREVENQRKGQQGGM